MTLLRALLVLVLLGAEAQAADAPLSPDRDLTLYGKQIPLPAGNWLAAGSAPTSKDSAGHPLPAPVVTLVLFRVEGGAVTAFVIVHTNIMPAGHGWGAAGACRRTDLYAATLDLSAGGDVSCSFVAPVTAFGAADEPSSSPAWRSALALAAECGWHLPETWLMAGARVGDREDFLEIRYHFDPGRWAGAAAASGDAAQVQVPQVQALIRWRLEMAAAVDRGLRNRLAPDFALSWPGDRRDGLGAAKDGRAEALDALLAEGRLSLAQYQAQRRLVAAPGQDASDTSPDLWMVGAKTVGWRLVVASSVALLSYAFTGSALVAGGITGVTALVNGGLYFGHELFWRNLDSTLETSPQTIDFVGAGITG